MTASATITVSAAYGSIDIKSSPAGATVYLDGIDTGSITPIVLTNVSAGIHTVKLELYGYQSKEDNAISVVAGETKYINWSLTPAATQILTLQPGVAEGKDAYVEEEKPNNPSGSKTLLFVGNDNLRYRSYLYFDVGSSLPSDAVVKSAYLKLYQFDFNGTGSLSIGLYQVTEDWEEDDISWNNQPTSSSVAEYTRGASSNTDIWRDWDIRDLVQAWLDGSSTNYGVLLKPVSEPTTCRAIFHSSDYPTSDFRPLRPQLVINYYIP